MSPESASPIAAAQIDSQQVDNKTLNEKVILLISDLVLVLTATWLVAASPMARTSLAVVAGTLLLMIGCVLGCLAVIRPRK